MKSRTLLNLKAGLLEEKLVNEGVALIRRSQEIEDELNSMTTQNKEP